MLYLTSWLIINCEKNIGKRWMTIYRESLVKALSLLLANYKYLLQIKMLCQYLDLFYFMWIKILLSALIKFNVQ